MKAEFYFTLLDGLLATAVYHPRKQNPGAPLRTLFLWSVPLSSATGSAESSATGPASGSLSTTVTYIPRSADHRGAGAGRMGMSTSATPVCGYCLP
ncbi:MAG: hypothetical protein ACYC6Z_04340 [Thermoleophilia bacterium]